MDTSHLVAIIYGTIATALGLGMLINSGYYKKVINDMMKDTTFMFMWSIFAILVGLLIILFHNIWVQSWVVIVTLIGWIGLVKGIFLMVFPRAVSIFEGWFKDKTFFMLAGGGSAILGVVMLYLGFFM